MLRKEKKDSCKATCKGDTGGASSHTPGRGATQKPAPPPFFSHQSFSQQKSHRYPNPGAAGFFTAPRLSLSKNPIDK